jgi:hypothetical protein
MRISKKSQIKTSKTKNVKFILQMPCSWSVNKAAAESGLSQYIARKERVSQKTCSILPDSEQEKSSPLSHILTQSPMFMTMADIGMCPVKGLHAYETMTWKTTH